MTLCAHQFFSEHSHSAIGHPQSPSVCLFLLASAEGRMHTTPVPLIVPTAPRTMHSSGDKELLSSLLDFVVAMILLPTACPSNLVASFVRRLRVSLLVSLFATRNATREPSRPFACHRAWPFPCFRGWTSRCRRTPSARWKHEGLFGRLSSRLRRVCVCTRFCHSFRTLLPV
jgi:hypothetical protein